MRGDAELKALTGIRGVAACLVVLYHYFQGNKGLGVVETFLKHSYIAVDLFFVLSGFVMALTYGATFRAEWSRQAYLQFLYKRLGRTYPLYLAVTLFAIFLTLVNGKPLGGAEIAGNLLLIQAWDVTNSIVGPSWSISTEFLAYVLFPLLTAVILFARRPWTTGAVCLALVALAVVATRPTTSLDQVYSFGPLRSGPLDAFSGTTVFPLLRCLAGFSLGLLAYRLSHVPAVWRVASARFTADLLLLAAIALMAIQDTDLVLVILFVPLVISLASSRSITARLLGWGVFYWLGVISYSIYLTHTQVLDMLTEPFQQAFSHLQVPHAYTVARLAVFASTLLISATTFYLIEKPGRDWSRRLLGFRRGRPIATEPAPP